MSGYNLSDTFVLLHVPGWSQHDHLFSALACRVYNRLDNSYPRYTLVFPAISREKALYQKAFRSQAWPVIKKVFWECNREMGTSFPFKLKWVGPVEIKKSDWPVSQKEVEALLEGVAPLREIEEGVKKDVE